MLHQQARTNQLNKDYFQKEKQIVTVSDFLISTYNDTKKIANNYHLLLFLVLSRIREKCTG